MPPGGKKHRLHAEARIPNPPVDWVLFLRIPTERIPPLFDDVKVVVRVLVPQIGWVLSVTFDVVDQGATFTIVIDPAGNVLVTRVKTTELIVIVQKFRVLLKVCTARRPHDVHEAAFLGVGGVIFVSHISELGIANRVGEYARGESVDVSELEKTCMTDASLHAGDPGF
jgi:hypothetical protein